MDSHGAGVTSDARPVRVRRVEIDLKWLKYVLAWGTTWRDARGRYLLRENCVRGYEIPTEKNPQRPVATQDRYEATRAVSDQVTMRLARNGKITEQRSYLSEVLDVVNGTGRRLSAVCKLRYSDLRLDYPPYGAIHWPALTDKMGHEAFIPMDAGVRAAIDRVLRERPGIGSGFLFPSPGDAGQPISRQRADRWLREAETLAGLKPQQGSLWHAYRRKWATERKHLPDVDVAASGGWRGVVSLKKAYQQADPATILKVVLSRGELREIPANLPLTSTVTSTVPNASESGEDGSTDVAAG
jgi:integrase